MGIIYLCTLGLFGCGWIIDSIKAILDIVNMFKAEQDKTIQNDNQPKVENKVEHKGLKFETIVETRDYSSARIQAVVDDYIKNDYFDKADLYEGLKNDEIYDITYQLPDYYFPCNIEPFEDSGAYGVYITSYNDENVFIGYIPKDRVNEFRKINLFGKITNGGLHLTGGKYKTYDEEKQKVVNKKEDYKVRVSLNYYFEDSQEAENKMKEVLKEEKDNKDKYKFLNIYIAGRNYDNEDGSSRQGYIDQLKDEDELLLETYFYQDEKAVKILTKGNKQIGNIPRDEATMIFDYIKENKIEKILYKPKWYNGRITDYRVEIFIKKN